MYIIIYRMYECQCHTYLPHVDNYLQEQRAYGVYLQTCKKMKC